MATWTAWHPDGAHVADAGRRKLRSALMLAVLVVTLRATGAAAEAPPSQLVLPLLATLALGRSMFQLQMDDSVMPRLGFARGEVPAKPTFIPSFLSIPDLYSVDVTDRDPPRFAAPVDTSKMLSLNLLPKSLSVNRSLSVVYDTESLPAFRDTSRVLKLEFEVDF
jgi:hypothetical protein